MTLRARLALTLAAVATPQVLGLLAWDALSRFDAASHVLGGMLQRALSESDARATCAAAPAAFGASIERGSGRPPPGAPPGPPRDGMPGGPPRDEARVDSPKLYVYNDDGHAAMSGSPAIRQPHALAEGTVVLVRRDWLTGELAVATRTGWGGPCALVAVTGSTVRGFLGSVLPRSELWLLPLVVTTGAVLLALGPVVRRVRKLEEAVRARERDGYAEAQPIDTADDEIGDLARAFAAASRAVRAEADARARREAALREFVANTSHDLLVPLTVLQGHLAAARDGTPTALPAAMDEAQYIGALVHNLAVAARLDGTADPPRETLVDLGPLATRVIARHRTVAAARGVSLDGGVPEEPVMVRCDETLLERAVGNLVHNAVRYAQDGGHVAVVLDVGRTTFALRVLDDGPGVDPALLDQLRARGFRSAEARSRSPEGLGLGLHIADRVASRFGFALSLGRGPHGGTEAILSGPLATSPPT